MNKCIFLDRDGVLNYDDPGYVYDAEKYRLYPGVLPTLARFKEMGFLLIIVTNQAGISKGIYNSEQMWQCFTKLQHLCDECIDDLYYAPYHPTVTRSLSRKPGTLMFERAIAKWNIDTSESWMIGDKPTDLQPAAELGIRSIGIQREHKLPESSLIVGELSETLPIISR